MCETSEGAEDQRTTGAWQEQSIYKQILDRHFKKFDKSRFKSTSSITLPSNLLHHYHSTLNPHKKESSQKQDLPPQPPNKTGTTYPGLHLISATQTPHHKTKDKNKLTAHTQPNMLKQRVLLHAIIKSLILRLFLFLVASYKSGTFHISFHIQSGFNFFITGRRGRRFNAYVQ